MARKGAAAAAIVEARRRRRNTGSFSLYIYRVLKQIHPTAAISKKGIQVVDDMVHDILDRLSEEAGRMARQSDRSALLPSDVQAAVRLVLPPELAKHAVSEGAKAITSYMLGETSGRKRKAPR